MKVLYSTPNGIAKSEILFLLQQEECAYLYAIKTRSNVDYFLIKNKSRIKREIYTYISKMNIGIHTYTSILKEWKSIMNYEEVVGFLRRKKKVIGIRIMKVHIFLQ